MKLNTSEKRNSMSTRNRVLFCLSYEHTNEDTFGDLPKFSDHFPKIFQNLIKKITQTAVINIVF